MLKYAESPMNLTPWINTLLHRLRDFFSPSKVTLELELNYRSK